MSKTRNASYIATGFCIGSACAYFLLTLSFTSNMSFNIPVFTNNYLTSVTKDVSQIRVLCWIMTSPSNYETKAIHVKKTWGKRCNHLLFMSSENDTSPEVVRLPNVKEGREWLWAKTKEAFKYIWKEHQNDADWFMKADDDTYVIVENLRLLLSKYNPDRPIYFGCKFKAIVEQGYMSGGAGYVLSKEALRRFVEQSLPDEKKCWSYHGGAEDAEIGKCLANVDVEAGDSRDELGRHRFMAFSPQWQLDEVKKDLSLWYWNYTYYPQAQGLDCCSDEPISFHYIPRNEMYALEYLLYHVKHYR